MTEPGAVRTILVVEDDRVHSRLYARVLERREWHIVIAETLEAADRALEGHEVALVILDLFLPDGDGRSWLTRVRARQATTSLPVIVIAGFAGAEAQIDLYALGAGPVLEKPVAPALLVAAVSGALRRGMPAAEQAVDPETGTSTRAAVEARLRSAHRPDARVASAFLVLGPDAAPADAAARAQMLKGIADCVRRHAPGAPVGRWGKSELAVILPSATPADAAAEASLLVATIGGELATTASAGVVPVDPSQSLEDIVAIAEHELTRARLAGGDRASWPGASADVARTVLLAEDDEVVAALVKHRLRREGYEVIHATNGPEAVAVATGTPLSLCILDVMMPGADGFEVLTTLRATPACARLPVIMLTGLGSERDVERALALGANDYVLKPFSPVELVARANRLMRRA